MKHKIMIKAKHLINAKKIPTFALFTLLATTCCLLPELALADSTANKDAFVAVYNKLSAWVGGSAGKVITIIAIAIAGFMGALGFSGKQVAGALGVGLLLSLATTIVDMIFG